MIVFAAVDRVEWEGEVVLALFASREEAVRFLFLQHPDLMESDHGDFHLPESGEDSQHFSVEEYTVYATAKEAAILIKLSGTSTKMT